MPPPVQLLPRFPHGVETARKEVNDIEAIIVSLIGLAGSAIGSLCGVLVSSKLTQYRLEQLEKKVQAHNSLIDRTYRLEERTELQEEKIKVANHRIDDLEKAFN